MNDILLGALYVIGSLMSILDGPVWIRQWTYLAGGIFMLMRPVLKILRNIFIYDEQEFKNKVSDWGFNGQDYDHSSQSEDSHQEYDESKNQQEKMAEIHRQEHESADNKKS